MDGWAGHQNGTFIPVASWHCEDEERRIRHGRGAHRVREALQDHLHSRSDGDIGGRGEENREGTGMHCGMGEEKLL